MARRIILVLLLPYKRNSRWPPNWNWKFWNFLKLIPEIHTYICSSTRDRRISIRGQIVAKKVCAAGRYGKVVDKVTILATKPNASSFPEIVLLPCNFTDEDKKPEIVVTLGVLQGQRYWRELSELNAAVTWRLGIVSAQVTKWAKKLSAPLHNAPLQSGRCKANKL